MRILIFSHMDGNWSEKQTVNKSIEGLVRLFCEVSGQYVIYPDGQSEALVPLRVGVFLQNLTTHLEIEKYNIGTS